MIAGRLAAAMAALFLCASGTVAGAQGKGETVKIQDYPGIGNMLFRVAVSKGYCEAHGIKCQLQMIPSGPLGAQALLARSIDVAFVPPEVLINASIKGAALKIILSGATLNVFHIVIRNDLDAPNAGKGYPALMTDLKGKKIGVPARGSGAELQFRLLAEGAGMKAEDFTFVAVGSPDTSYGALLSRQIDASMTFEPSASMCDVLKTCKTVFRGNTSKEPAVIARTNGASAVLVVSQEAIDKSPHVQDALIAAAKDAETFLQDPNNFDEALKIAQSYFRFNMPNGDEVMQVSLKTSVPAYQAAVSRAALQQIADNMLATNQIEAKFDTSKLLHSSAP
ncbi:MAG: ABC transporter substrate-binding protein [Bradyrhizobium sp.]|nr:ABC transporter substrate-binding protein [Bradyrhizobium sp.]